MRFWRYGFIKLNGTIVFTWGLMLLLTVGSALITRRLSTDLKRARWQNIVEIVVTGITEQIEEVGLPHPEEYLGFLGTLFLCVAPAAVCTTLPGDSPPTGVTTRDGVVSSMIAATGAGSDLFDITSSAIAAATAAPIPANTHARRFETGAAGTAATARSTARMLASC